MAGPTTNPYRFGAGGGYRRDGANRDYVRARHLDAQRGRWISRGPITFGGDRNLFRYVKNRPTFAIDPTGLEPDDCLKFKDLPRDIAKIITECEDTAGWPRAIDQHKLKDCLKCILSLPV